MARLNPSTAKKPSAATPKASRMECRRRSRSSCNSTSNNAMRFPPLVKNRCANRLDEATSCSKLAVAGSIVRSVAIFAGATAGDQIAEQCPAPESDADRLIRMFAHGLVGGFGSRDGFFTNAAGDFPGAFQRGGETFAGLPDL